MNIMTNRGLKDVSSNDIILYDETSMIIIENNRLCKYSIPVLERHAVACAVIFLITADVPSNDGEYLCTLAIENLINSGRITEFMENYPDYFIRFKDVLKRFNHLKLDSLPDSVQLALEI